MKKHLSDAELADLQFETLEGDRLTRCQQHLSACQACRKRAEQLSTRFRQLDLAKEESAPPEQLVARTMAAIHGGSHHDGPTLIPARSPVRYRAYWIWIAAAAALVVLAALPSLLHREPPVLAASAAKNETSAAAPAAERRDRMAMVAAADAVHPQTVAPMPASAPAPKVVPPVPSLRQTAMGGAAEPPGAPLQAPTLQKQAAASLATPVMTRGSIPASPARAETVEEELAADLQVRIPSTSGTWLTGPQNAIRVRAARREREVDFTFVNQGSILAARIRIVEVTGSNTLQTIFLPPLARTNISIKIAK